MSTPGRRFLKSAAAIGAAVFVVWTAAAMGLRCAGGASDREPRALAESLSPGARRLLDATLGQRGADDVIHHSDQGCQYTSIAFGLRCKEAGVRPSMGSVADCYDNAMCESFFATLECELLDQKPLRTQAEARMAVFDFIEGWYNPHRRHSALGYQSPSAFERESRELGGSVHEPRSLVHR